MLKIIVIVVLIVGFAAFGIISQYRGMNPEYKGMPAQRLAKNPDKKWAGISVALLILLLAFWALAENSVVPVMMTKEGMEADALKRAEQNGLKEPEIIQEKIEDEVAAIAVSDGDKIALVSYSQGLLGERYRYKESFVEDREAFQKEVYYAVEASLRAYVFEVVESDAGVLNITITSSKDIWQERVIRNVIVFGLIVVILEIRRRKHS